MMPWNFGTQKFKLFNEIQCILWEFVKFHAEPVCIQLDMIG